MSCQEFNKRGYLFLSGELSRKERYLFRRHLKKCQDCYKRFDDARKMWKLMGDLPGKEPSNDVRASIFDIARRNRPKLSHSDSFRYWILPVVQKRRITWGICMTAVAVIFILVIVKPFRSTGTTDSVTEEMLVWHDNFFAEADWIENEIDRVESGKLLATYALNTGDDDIFSTDDWLSPMSGDFEWIRGKVKELMKNIYGI